MVQKRRVMGIKDERKKWITTDKRVIHRLIMMVPQTEQYENKLNSPCLTFVNGKGGMKHIRQGPTLDLTE